MAKDLLEKNNNNNSTLVGISYTCADLKFFITALLFLFSLATVLQFLPPHSLSPLFSATSSAATSLSQCPTNNTTTTPPSSEDVKSNRDTNFSKSSEELLENGVVKRRFIPSGAAAAYAFVLMSAYRGGPHTFSVNALSSKPFHVYGRPSYTCLWTPHNSSLPSFSSPATKFLPDWGYGHVYTVVILNCTFPTPTNTDNSGGDLTILSYTNGAYDRNSNETDRIIALTESPGKLNLSYYDYNSPPKYDYLYCGSSLYGDLSPQRVREWLVYHVKFFGERTHFVIHDAGGIHEGVREVLRPWMERGYVTLHDIRDQERFDGYYHNQFLVVNDCLHRYKFDAKWMFFFDVDEFMFVPKGKTVRSVTEALDGYTQFTIEQVPMSGQLCFDEGGKTYRKWGFEKLVYKDSRTRIRRDRKYAVQPRNVLATGVHMSENVVGKTTHKTEGQIKYYHYHGTIAQRREPCRQLLNTTAITREGIPYALDTTMREVAANIKRFELKMIGPTLQRTRQ